MSAVGRVRGMSLIFSQTATPFSDESDYGLKPYVCNKSTTPPSYSERESLP